MSPTSAPLKELHWLLVEAPLSLDGWRDWLPTLTDRCQGVMVRTGEGVSPLVVQPLLHQAGLQAGVFVHLRDMNRVALGSLVRSVVAEGFQRLFIGDPFPLASVSAVGAADGPAFVEFVRTIAGQRLRLGACNLLAHPRDVSLAEKLIDAGVTTLAVPANPARPLTGAKVEWWNWRRSPLDPVEDSRINLADLSSLGPLPSADLARSVSTYLVPPFTV